MKGQLNLYYDEEGDFLELHVGAQGEGTFKNLGEGVFERVDTDGTVRGIAIMGFKKRTENLKDLNVSLPVQIELSG
ncbi:MAG: hypothetical protein OXR66_04970 [Candidatus Woesearchaeota archaeon]|nr:hypothetical protein [Candidatus Woesearchaeota archaeon]